MTRLAIIVGLAIASNAFGADDALAEVNAARVRRGLRPFVADPGLTIAAKACADHRAAHLIRGHIPGRMGDFAFLPAGVKAKAAGCSALTPEWGINACCMWEGWTYAGAAKVMGRDGRLYVHLWVR